MMVGSLINTLVKTIRPELGDWEVTHDKLPNGIPHLVQVAKDAGVKFGIWIEPEMVNPKSELFEKHPDWAIHLPNRETITIAINLS